MSSFNCTLAGIRDQILKKSLNKKKLIKHHERDFISKGVTIAECTHQLKISMDIIKDSDNMTEEIKQSCQEKRGICNHLKESVEAIREYVQSLNE